jgi:hypothetical protein
MWWDGISARHHRGILAMPRSRATPKALEDERAPMRALGSKVVGFFEPVNLPAKKIKVLRKS